MGRFLGLSIYKTSLAKIGQADISANTILVSNTIYFVNTTSGPVTLTLPSSPGPGEYVDIIDSYAKFDTNNCIVNPSGDGSTVAGFTDNLTLNLGKTNIRLQYSPGRNDWVITQLL